MTGGQAGLPGAIGLARRAIEAWALAGGAVLIGLVLMSAWSVVAGALWGAPIPGDFEIIEVGVAIAAFAFLPYCQLEGGNVAADIFTSRAGPRTLALLGALASSIAFAFALFLMWRMSEGMADYRQYLEVTTILQYPVWITFVPILASLALLALASAISFGEAVGWIGKNG